jgi:YebC/PmpR family DNA-binding regulatory protein
MGGHNKWSQIKREKGAADAAKSRVWGKFAKRIAVESKKANGDTSAPGLRTIIETARKANMPKENIERAVLRGISADAETLESVTYETYGPGGVAILIETLTDNRNRTAQEIKHLLAELGFALASPGSASWAFEKGVNTWTPKTAVPLSADDASALEKLLESIGAHDDVEEIYTNAQ